LATQISYILLNCTGITIGFFTDKLLVDTYALSRPCIPVSNAVVE